MISKLYCSVFLFNLVGVLALNPCDRLKTCGECVRDSNSCKWCSTNNFNGIRCKSETKSFDGCTDVENPKSFKRDEENQNFSSATGSVIQIKPQQYYFKIKPGKLIGFDFSFKGADNYPVDLYFLIDASTTMINIKGTLINESENIYNEMKKLTNNVFLGMGSFIDKNALPYTRQLNSTETYSFKHGLKLTDNVEDFKKVAIKTRIGTNYDSPEGGLDALAQVLACNDVIGWRDQSTKIVIFLTDAPSHSAGDGRWAGITKPYDGKCYTYTDDTLMVYTKELEMDYPSFSMINKLASKEGIIILFAVDKKYKGTYEKMRELISGSQVIDFDKDAPVLTFRTKNLQKLLTDIYKEITNTIKINLVGMPSQENKNIEINFDPDCSSKNATYIDTNCKIENGKEIHIKGNLKVLRYYNKGHETIDVAIQGIKESLKLNISIIEDCDCNTNKSKIEYNATYCSSGGNLECGLCQCYPNRYGDKCQCTTNENDGQVGSNASCIAPGEKELCSGGRGDCVCGTCLCQPGYEGEFCQCNENSCPSQCSNNGKCLCGTCECFPGWEGEICNCDNRSDKKCRSKDGGVCSNRGICECGNCVCSPIAPWDARRARDGLDKNSEHCTVYYPDDGQNKQCSLLAPCAVCRHKNTTECPICHQDIIVNITDVLSNIDGALTCEDVSVGFGCTTSFKYQYETSQYKIKLFVQSKKDCIPTYYWSGAVFLVVLLLIGIATIIAWKLLQDHRDRKEYERFLKHHGADASDACSNPIYEPATTTFHNPAFEKISFRS